jgi:cell division protein FtsQ
MNKNVKGLIIISVHLLILMGVGMAWMWSIREQRVSKSNKVQVNILRSNNENILITEQELLTHISQILKKDFRKVRVSSLNLKNIESVAKSLPVIASAEVFIDANNALNVQAIQRDPLFRIVDHNGEQFYIDSEGNKIPYSKNYSARVPVVTGNIPSLAGNTIWRKENQIFHSIFGIVKSINDDPFTKSLIEQINIDDLGQYSLVPKVGNEKIVIGKLNNLQDKLSRLKFFYQEGLRYEGWNVYETIDLKNDNQVVCKKYESET